MSDFSDFTSIVPYGNTGEWLLTKAMDFEIGGKGSGVIVRVNAGFISDGPSIPAYVRPWLNPADSRFMKAALLHDFLLEKPGFSRTIAAICFRDALLAAEVPNDQATLMAFGVWVYTVLIKPWYKP